jgi:antitoxin FitA
MATITIRKLKDEVRDALRVQAAKKGRSLEAEAREIIELSVGGPHAINHARLRQAIEEGRRQMREANGGHLPTIDEFIVDKRAEAARESAEYQRDKT